MDLSEDAIKEEVSSFVFNLQKILPKRKEILNVINVLKPKMCRLSDIHAEAKNVFPKCFIGAKLVVLREIMDKVKLSQQYNYGKPKEPYKCFTQLLYKEMEPKTTGQTLVVDTSASATATYKENLDNGYDMHLTSKIRDLFSSETELVFEKNTDEYYGGVICAMSDVDPATLRVISQCMKQVMPDVNLGLEVGFKPFSHPPLPDFSISARYDKPAFTLSSTFSKYGLQMCCYKKFSDDIQVAAILNEGQDVSPTIGLAVRKAFLNGSELKMFIDTQRCGGLTYQKDVFMRENLNEVKVLAVTASGLIDKQRRFRFGIGFNIDF